MRQYVLLYDGNYFIFAYRNINHSSNFLKIDQYEIPKLSYFKNISLKLDREKWKDYLKFDDAIVYLVNYYDVLEDLFELNIVNKQLELINLMEDNEITKLAWIHISEIRGNIYKKEWIMDTDLNMKRTFHQHNYVYLRELINNW